MKWIDEYNMMLEGITGDQGRGDALWRTSLAYIAYGWPPLMWAIWRCFKFDKIWRHPTHDGKNTSRDQVIMAQVAFYLQADHIIDIPYRISEKFTMRDSWLWYQAIRGSRIANHLWRFISVFSVWFMPDYSRHIWSWMVYIIPGQKPLLNRIGKLLAGEDNLLMILLHHGHVSWDRVEMYTPKEDFYWQRGKRGPIKAQDLKNTPHEKYPIDKDVLIEIYMRNKTVIKKL